MIKVLFILYQNASSSLIKEPELLSCIKQLNTSEQHFLIGLLTNKIIPSSFSTPKKIMTNHETLNISWDLVVVQDEIDLGYFSKLKLLNPEPKLLIISTKRISQPFYTSQKNKVFLAASYSPVYEIEIFNTENFVKLPWSELGFRFRKSYRNKPANILYYIAENSHLATAAELLKLFDNSSQLFKATILCNSRLEYFLSKISSIKSSFSKLTLSLSHPVTVAIACDKIALSTILSGIPTIIVGELGYGGLVTPQNIVEHFETRFNGRIGGSSYEYVPAKIIENEILNVRTFHALNKNFLEENIAILLQIMSASDEFQLSKYITSLI